MVGVGGGEVRGAGEFGGEDVVGQYAETVGGGREGGGSTSRHGVACDDSWIFGDDGTGVGEDCSHEE